MPVTLTAAQIESVREMVGTKTFSTIQSLIDDLENDAQRTATIADVVLWEADKNKLAVKLEGGSDGIKFDKVPALRAIRRRVMLRLGLDVSNNGGLFYIPVGRTYSGSCDA